MKLTRRGLVQKAAAVAAAGAISAARLDAGEPAAQARNPASTREQWLGWLERVAEPVLLALSRRELRATMPVEAVAGHEADRAVGSPLEATGRLLMGIAPWLELAPSGR